jgi:WD40 repeat-containing protein SMU1
MMGFMREHGLTRSLAALTAESRVPLAAVDDGDALQEAVLAGRWEFVLAALSGVSLPPALSTALFEQVFCELCEAREAEAARALLRGAAPLRALAGGARGARLEALAAAAAAGGAWAAAAVYGAGGGAAARAALARGLAAAVASVPPGRLVALLGQALRWQAAAGGLPPAPAGAASAGALRYDVFRGALPLRRDAEERPCALPAGDAAAADGGGGGLAPLTFGAAAHPMAADFTPDGARLVVGCVDGIIECYDAEGGSGALCADLAFQAADEFMMHDDAVLCLAVARPAGDLLASGSRDGAVKVWRLASGEAVAKFAAPHGGAGGAPAGVTALAFSRDASLLLTGGFDGLVKVHGLRSGTTLKAYAGHAGTVTALAVSGDGAYVSGSADGTVRVWAPRGAECVAVLRPPAPAGGGSALGAPPILAVLPLPHAADQLLVVPRGAVAYVMTTRGALVRALALPPPAAAGARAPTITAVTLSPRGRFVYAAADDAGLYVFSARSGALEARLLPRAAAEPGAGWLGGDAAGPPHAGVGDALGLVHHPTRNQLAAFASDGQLRVFVPERA